jgi:ABC-type amino acid transport substrate-binding protein
LEGNLLLDRNKITFFNIVLIATILICSMLFSKAIARQRIKIPGKLLVGVTEFPPYSMKTKDGKWEGFSIELWQAVTKELGTEFEIKEYNRLKQVTEAIHNAEIDLTTAMPVTGHNETIMDLSHSFYRSGLGIAVGLEGHRFSIQKYVKRFTSFNTLKIILLLIMVSLMAGLIVWLFERKRNREMFGDDFAKGLGQGIWWAMVTMTTVGYGDKAPKTIGGRTVAVAWMFFSVILIASYTAVITTSLTVDGLSGRVSSPRDLPDVRVGALGHSETLEHLSSVGISAMPFESIEAGLQAVVENKIDAFVDNEAQLKYIVKTGFPSQLHILSETFAHYFVSMGIPSKNPLREPLNRALVKFMEQDDWPKLKERYLGK